MTDSKFIIQEVGHYYLRNNVIYGQNKSHYVNNIIKLFDVDTRVVLFTSNEASTNKYKMNLTLANLHRIIEHQKKHETHLIMVFDNCDQFIEDNLTDGIFTDLLITRSQSNITTIFTFLTPKCIKSYLRVQFDNMIFLDNESVSLYFFSLSNTCSVETRNAIRIILANKGDEHMMYIRYLNKMYYIECNN
jgi:hypothetical protein